MSTEFRVPDIGEGIAEVEILEWHVGVGEQIQADQVVATVETAKAVVEMPTPLTGTVVSLGAEPGERLPVGAVLITVEDGPGAIGPSPVDRASVLDRGGSGSEPPVAARPKAAPAVRRFALEHGVDLQGLRGTGPGGRITREDVLAAVGEVVGSQTTARGSAMTLPQRPAAGSGPEGDDERVPLRGLRREIAQAMVASWRSVPHIIDYREVDATRLIEARASMRAAWPEHAEALTFVPLFVKVAATALRRHPLMNASFDEEAQEYVLHRRVHIGVATATAEGLLVPVVRDADRKSILELALEIAELVGLARARRATLEQLRGGTYTINNFGAIGASMGTPIIRIPEVGIAGFGRIGDRVVARGGVAVVRPMLTLSSVGDHRLHDGDTLGNFTSTLVRLLEAPYELLAELA